MLVVDNKLINGQFCNPGDYVNVSGDSEIRKIIVSFEENVCLCVQDGEYYDLKKINLPIENNGNCFQVIYKKRGTKDVHTFCVNLLPLQEVVFIEDDLNVMFESSVYHLLTSIGNDIESSKLVVPRYNVSVKYKGGC